MIKWTLAIKFTLLLPVFSAGIYAQIATDRYWIQFSDKLNSPFSIENPQAYLSQRAINRRNQHKIDIDTLDLPVNQAYLDSLKAVGLIIINTSKWLNGAMVETNDISLVNRALKLSFVSGLPIQYSIQKTENPRPKKFFPEQKYAGRPSYGESANQIEMLNGNYLHNKNYLGQEMLITVLDAGFYSTDQISSLQHLWNNNRIKALRDFVKDGSSFFETYQHGTMVLTSMAGVEDNLIYGSAPEANYVLVRTEQYSSEYLIEEYNWVCGAEFADSMGTDVINSSLSYTEFDDMLQNHTYSDMDGKSNISAIGAGIASSKGIIVVNSAGNEGNSDWHRIGSPADADGIISVGAVNPKGIITGFSSRGPSFDGRIKPDVCAQGSEVIVQNQSGGFVEVSGTSLSSPLIAGMAACLWQANPDATNLLVMDAIRKSSSRYSSPDSAYGYGIPDFGKADLILKNLLIPGESLPFVFIGYPNPVIDFLYIEIYQKQFEKRQEAFISICDLSGSVVKESSIILLSESSSTNLDLTDLPTGVFYLTVSIEGRVYSSIFIKIK